jgi:uncharacterized protein (TIGR03435 family)
VFKAIVGIAACCAAAYAQSAPAPIQRFEVATVKPSVADSSSSSGIKTGHGRLDAQNVTLKRCIIGAYGVGPQQITGGPDWLDADRFEILAKAEQPVNDDAVLMLMLQDLLAERFRLVVHRETKTVPAFVLEVAKNGPKLERAVAGEASTNTSTSSSGITIDARNTDMESFAKILARRTDLPVLNHTGLAGIFNFKLQWTPDSNKPSAAGTEGVSLFTAIQEQLGLRLRSQKAPIEALVIDHAEKPKGN